MAIVVAHDQDTLNNGTAHSVLRAAAPTAVGLILQNMGTGIVYFTLNGTAPSKTNGLQLAPKELKAMMGAAWSDPGTGESFVLGEIRGLYLGGQDPGGADPDNAVINIVNVTNPP